MTKTAPHSKVSVIVPMFNAERFIKTCIDSILNQTLRDFEIIIVDDCSDDKSREIVEEYRDSRIKLYRNITNLGDAGTRNAGLAIASGKYVYFMDDDDAILPNTLEVMYQAAEEYQSEIIHMNSHYVTFDEEFSLNRDIDVTKIFDNNPKPRLVTENLVERLQSQLNNLDLGVMPWKKLSRRDFLFKHRLYFPLAKINNDIFQTIGELCLARKIRVIDFCGYVARVYKSSQVHLDSKKNLERSVESIPILVQYLEEIFSKKLIEPLSRSYKLLVEEFVIESAFQIFIRNAYEEFSIDEVDRMLENALAHVNSSLIARIFFHLKRKNYLELLKMKGIEVR